MAPKNKSMKSNTCLTGRLDYFYPEECTPVLLDLQIFAAERLSVDLRFLASGNS